MDRSTHNFVGATILMIFGIVGIIHGAARVKQHTLVLELGIVTLIGTTFYMLGVVIWFCKAMKIAYKDILRLGLGEAWGIGVGGVVLTSIVWALDNVAMQHAWFLIVFGCLIYYVAHRRFGVVLAHTIFSGETALLFFTLERTCYHVASCEDVFGCTACKDGWIFTILTYIITLLPFSIRGLHCCRLYLHGPNQEKLYDMAKNVVVMIAIFFGIYYTHHPYSSLGVIIAYWIFTVTATIVESIWDIYIDWGFTNPRKKGIFLYTSIAINILLRCVWIYTLLITKEIIRVWATIVVSSMELGRWCLWACYWFQNNYRGDEDERDGGSEDQNASVLDMEIGEHESIPS